MIGHDTQMSRVCPHCGSSVPNGAFCPACGVALPPAPTKARSGGAPWTVVTIAAAVLVLAVAAVVIVLRFGSGGVGGTAVAGPDGGSGSVTSRADAPTATAGSRVTSEDRPPSSRPGGTTPVPTGAGTADTNAYRGYALADGQPLTQDASGYALYFTSPSRNIHCRMTFGTADQAGDATCFIGEKQWTGAPAPAGCGANWAENYVAVSAAGVQSGLCLSDVPVPPVSAELPYGQSLSTGAVTCASAETGVTCLHLASGRGFTLSRQGLTPF